MGHLSLTKPGFFGSWTSRICKLEQSNQALFDTCVNLVEQFTRDPAFHEKAKSAKTTVVRCRGGPAAYCGSWNKHQCMWSNSLRIQPSMSKLNPRKPRWFPSSG